MKTLIKYIPELAVFGLIVAVLLTCATPDYTWVNTDSDGIHYVYSAEYLFPAHKTSAPLFLLSGHAFIKLIPFGTEAWRLALLSVTASVISSVFIYLTIRFKLNRKDKAVSVYEDVQEQARQKKHRAYALIGALIFGGSALVVSQSTIVESYALVTMFGMGAYYFALKKQWLWCAIMLGAGGAVHHIIGITGLVLFLAYKGLRKWRYVGIMGLFLLFYLYVPISAAVNHPPDMWGNQTVGAYVADNLTTAAMLIGGLAIYDLPKRILDTAGVTFVSLWLALVPIVFYLVKARTKTWYKEPLLWLFVLPIGYYATNLAPQTYVYVMPAIGFGAVLAGVGLARMKKGWAYAVLVVSIITLLFNWVYFDIGRTLDKNQSAAVYYYEELQKVPDGGILLAQQGWEWAAVYPFNKNEGRNIIPVSAGTLPSEIYRANLREQGVLVDYKTTLEADKLSALVVELAESILELNDDVWITKPTDPATYGARVEEWDGSSIDWAAQEPLGGNLWSVKPSNPYGIITGAVEVEEWRDITFTNYSVMTFVMFGMIGVIPVLIGYQLVVKKKKWSPKKGVEKK